MKHLVVIFCTHTCGVYEALIPTDQFQEEYIILFQSVRKDQEIYANQKQGLICTKKFEVGDDSHIQANIRAIDELKIAGRTPNLDVKHQISQTGRVAIKCVFMACSPWVWTAGRDFQKIIKSDFGSNSRNIHKRLNLSFPAVYGQELAMMATKRSGVFQLAAYTALFSMDFMISELAGIVRQICTV
ncbi:Hypothetical_protein [Hexamita inflata]|uniref:Hypothetical_protein n=1 Tax=Hexamita inflata TaxID=28002 RepID=A0ABP1K211_9EUKA